MAFLETPVFPEAISYGSRGGPRYSTTIVRMRSGHEKRVQNWSETRYVFDAAYAIQDDVTMRELIAFFHVAEGMSNGFRFRDPLDHNNENSYYADNWMYTGDADGSSNTFLLYKYYKPGTATTTAEKVRRIRKPRNDGSWQVGQGGGVTAGGGPTDTNFTEGVDFTIDYTEGRITWTTTPPAVAMWWKGNFDVPCRFGVDELSPVLEAYQSNTAQVPIVEIRQDDD